MKGINSNREFCLFTYLVNARCGKTSYFGYDVLDNVSFPSWIRSGVPHVKLRTLCYSKINCQSPQSPAYTSTWSQTWIEYLH